MSLMELHTPLQAADWLRSRVQGDLQGDSRRVQTGDGFLAWPGRRHDARLAVPQVLGQGAAACVVDNDGLTQLGLDQLDPGKVVSYAQLKSASGWIADAFYAQPSRAMAMVAITGTNGKTSTSWWLSQVLNDLNQPCSVVGTLGLGRVQPDAAQGQMQLMAEPGHDGLTTPDAIALHRQLRRWVDAGLKACVMEASSIGLVEQRMAGVQLHTAVFTNLTPDHLDYHGSWEAYGQAKASLFEWVGLKVAVVHVDDPFGQALAQRLHHQRPELDVWTVSSREANPLAARVHLTALRDLPQGQGQVMDIQWPGGTQRVQTTLLGRFNVDNLLLVWAVLMAWGLPADRAAHAMAGLLPVPGRMQRLGGEGLPHVVIDYAHTPDAVSKVLAQVAHLARSTQGRVITVLGCGGDRDRLKRPLMAREAQRHSDQLWITSDNPRSEDPQAIAHDMQQGLGTDGATVRTELQRDQAIAQAIAQARAQDWVVIAGKGSEAYQDVQGVRHPFLDASHAQLALQNWRVA